MNRNPITRLWLARRVPHTRGDEPDVWTYAVFTGAAFPTPVGMNRRFVRYYRARGRCEWCGAKNHKPHPVTGSLVVLTTAHVYDHRPEAASLLNLAALCQRCHNRHDAKMRRKHRIERKRRESGQLELAV